MQKFEQKNPKVKGWIFFDFEASQDDELREDKHGNKVYEHKVRNLANFFSYVFFKTSNSIMAIFLGESMCRPESLSCLSRSRAGRVRVLWPESDCFQGS
jgi:hypothetical protein